MFYVIDVSNIVGKMSPERERREQLVGSDNYYR